jgi:hypothetical protein
MYCRKNISGVKSSLLALAALLLFPLEQLDAALFQGNAIIRATAGTSEIVITTTPRLSIAEIVSRAKLVRKHKGNMPIRLLGEEYGVLVEEYEHFGESAFTLTLKKKGKKPSE